jgi:hypothetical protein
MMNRPVSALLICAICAVLLSGCSTAPQTAAVPTKHPEELSGYRPDCGECHQDVSTGALKPYEAFRHSQVFLREHGFYARQGQNLCASCHGPSFCQGCHARKEELMPKTRAGDRPDRMLPHRGDYIVLHQIDGRLDPGSCFRCHGNKNNARCRACHR